jgi:hypothetical protein
MSDWIPGRISEALETAGDKACSPLWLRVVYDSAACASVHNLETALQAKKVAAEVLFINCPIVSIKH